MNKKRFLTLMLAFVLCAVFLPSVNFAEAETAPVVKKMVNVAQNKYVYSGGGNAGANAQKLTDGKRNTDYSGAISTITLYPGGAGKAETALLPSGAQGPVASGQANDWFMIDLGRQFNVKEVRLYDARMVVDESGAAPDAARANDMKYVEIQGSNTEDFAEYDVLLDINDTVTWEHLPYYAVKQENVRPYRYIRVQKTGSSYYGFSEFEVYSDVTLTEISQKKSVVASSESYPADYPAVETVDGKVEGGNGWLVEGAAFAPPHYMTVDLGGSYPVSWVEMEARVMTANENPATRNNWTVYGAEEEPALDTITSGNKLIPDILSGFDGNYTYLFPPQSQGKLSMPIYNSGTGRNIENMRYVTFYKTTGNVALSEVRVFVMNPELLISEVKDNALTLGFSEEMDSVEDYISVYNITDKKDVLNPLIETLDDGTIKISTPDLFDKDIRVLVSEDAKNTKGVSLGAAQAFTFKTAKALTAEGFNEENIKLSDANGEEASLSDAKKAEMELTLKNASTESISVILILAAYDKDGNLLVCNAENADVGSENVPLSAELSLENVEEISEVKALLIDGYSALGSWTSPVTKK